MFYTKKFNLNSWLQKQEKGRKRLLDHVFFIIFPPNSSQYEEKRKRAASP